MSIRSIWIVLVVAAIGWLPPAARAEAPKSVILMIADGMGPPQVRAARMYHGQPLSFETLPHHAMMTTRAADNPVTDSAAAATAMATGVKVNNRVISLAIPGDGRRLPTMLELFADQGKATGLVTDDELTQATPAAFGAHATNRKDTKEIARWYLSATQPIVLMGGGDEWMTPNYVSQAGYTVFTTTRGMKQAAASVKADAFIMLAGVFGEARYPYLYHDAIGKEKAYGPDGYPRLVEMTKAALRVLDLNASGFFVMIEGAHVDKSGHAQLVENDEDRTGCNVFATIAFSEAVQAAIDFAKGRDDVLIVVTSDHETGGMHDINDNGPGKLPTVKWAHTQHTGIDVDVWAIGPGAERFSGTIDNTDIFHIIADLCDLKVTAEAVNAAAP